MTGMAGTKLVRDRLSERIPHEELSIATDGEMGPLLDRKLDEEIRELRDSGFRDAAEFADVEEVLRALAARAGLSPSDIEAARASKLALRGGFERGLVWNPPGS